MLSQLSTHPHVYLKRETRSSEKDGEQVCDCENCFSTFCDRFLPPLTRLTWSQNKRNPNKILNNKCEGGKELTKEVSETETYQKDGINCNEISIPLGI